MENIYLVRCEIVKSHLDLIELFIVD